MKNLQSFTLIYLFVHLCLVSFSSCKKQTKEVKIEEKITVLYQEAAAVEQKLIPNLESLIQKKNGINVQGRGLSVEEITFVKQVEEIETRFEEWKKNHAKRTPDQLLKNKDTMPWRQLLAEQQKSNKEVLSISNRIEALQK